MLSQFLCLINRNLNIAISVPKYFHARDKETPDFRRGNPGSVSRFIVGAYRRPCSSNQSTMLFGAPGREAPMV